MKSRELFVQMKSLGFKSKAVIEDEAHKYGLQDFQVNDDNTVSTFNDVSFYNQNFSELPFKFKFVEGRFSVGKCHNLITLEGFPSIIAGSVSIHSNNKLTSFHNIHKHINQIHGVFDCGNATHILGLCTIKGIEAVGHFKENVARIMNDHLHDMILCQQTLIDAGFAEYAKL